MRTNKILIASIIGAAFIVPGVVLAEETTTGTDGSVTSAPVAPVPTLYRESPSRPSTGGTIKPVRALAPEGARMATGTVREDIRNKVAEEREERMEKRASSTEERRERIMEARKKMMEKRLEIMKRIVEQQVHRFEKMIERLTKLADRLESRIQKIEGGEARYASSTGGGVGKVSVQDLSFTKAALAKTRTELDKAKTALAVAKTNSEQAVAAAKVRIATGDIDGDGAPDVVADTDASDEAAVNVDLGKTIREELQKARQAIVAAHKALVEAISSLNMGRRGGDTGTTTVQ